MKYHLIGIGGIGMSALARILHQKGERVCGSDLNPSPLLEQLSQEGIDVQIGHSAEGMDDETAVIYSTDIQASNVEMQEAKKRGLPLFHRSDLLDRLLSEKSPLLVTGTHGKTTTSALLASVLMTAGEDPSFALGGVLRTLKVNGRSGKGKYFVAEADESDGSFLKTKSYGAIVTNLENDHMNYWGSEDALNRGFARFFAQVQHPKHLFWCGDDPRLRALNPPGISYGFTAGVELPIARYGVKKGGIVFDLPGFAEIELNLMGRHNALNGAAVFGLCRSLEIPETAIRKAFREFSGTGRRLEQKGEAKGVLFYDDYGHHPTEISVTLCALREQIGKRRLVVLFQPHRYTRVKDLFSEFGSCFEAADVVILTEIYSAGEAPLRGFESETLYRSMREKLGTKLHFFARKAVEPCVADLLKEGDVLLTIGAGDVTRCGPKILKHLTGSD